MLTLPEIEPDRLLSRGEVEGLLLEAGYEVGLRVNHGPKRFNPANGTEPALYMWRDVLAWLEKSKKRIAWQMKRREGLRPEEGRTRFGDWLLRNSYTYRDAHRSLGLPMYVVLRLSGHRNAVTRARKSVRYNERMFKHLERITGIPADTLYAEAVIASVQPLIRKDEAA